MGEKEAKDTLFSQYSEQLVLKKGPKYFLCMLSTEPRCSQGTRDCTGRRLSIQKVTFFMSCFQAEVVTALPCRLAYETQINLFLMILDAIWVN